MSALADDSSGYPVLTTLRSLLPGSTAESENMISRKPFVFESMFGSTFLQWTGTSADAGFEKQDALKTVDVDGTQVPVDLYKNLLTAARSAKQRGQHREEVSGVRLSRCTAISDVGFDLPEPKARLINNGVSLIHL
mmetsp:Transcript_63261/g.150889  ORF Transcript_63261/g.150889 Transcript_63261/m.150889 type:complete len:136 (-) Transcript_63261:46-453(-)